MDQVDLMDKMDKIGAPLNNPWVGGAAGWNGSGADRPRRYAAVTVARLEETAAASVELSTGSPGESRGGTPPLVA